MINVDVSKFLNTRIHEHLAGFLPGLFFVFSIALANPDLVAHFATNASHGLALGYYATLGMALFLAFIIGQGFILLITLIQYFFGYAYRLKLFLSRQLCRWPLRQIMRWLLTKKPKWGRVQAFNSFMVRVIQYAQIGFVPNSESLDCRRVLAGRLLKVRMGIEPRDLDTAKFEVLYPHLGRPTSEDLRGFMVLIACHATGWAGLVATRFAPALRNRYYIGFCVFLILNGLLHDYYVAMHRIDPRINPGMAIRAVLREFPKLEKANVPPSEPTGT